MGVNLEVPFTRYDEKIDSLYLTAYNLIIFAVRPCVIKVTIAAINTKNSHEEKL